MMMILFAWAPPPFYPLQTVQGGTGKSFLFVGDRIEDLFSFLGFCLKVTNVRRVDHVSCSGRKSPGLCN